jgi:NADPH:quinone reductase-like Zn-dependent oxidoreductase
MMTTERNPTGPQTAAAAMTAPPRTTTMRAVVQNEYGEADVLRLEDVARPQSGPGEVLVRVHAAGVDRGVWHLMAGLPYAIRLAGFGVRRPKNRVRGRELAGRVESVGPDVTTVRPGDEVFGIGEGTFAEYVRAPAAKLAAKPVNLTFEQASVVPISATTALQAIRDHGRVQAGQTVLIIGASGGVGTFAVQIAKAFGAQVTGVASTAKVDLVRSLGADHVLDYEQGDIADGGRRYDVVLDIGGNRSLRTLRRLLEPTGTLVLVGGEDGGRILGLGRQLMAMVLSPFIGQKLRAFIASETAADLVVLTELIEAGTVVPAVDRTFPLDQGPAAVAYMRDGRARGKVAVTV